MTRNGQGRPKLVIVVACEVHVVNNEHAATAKCGHGPAQLEDLSTGCVWETLTAAGVPLDQMAGAREVPRRGIAIVQGEAEHNRQDQIREFPGNAVQARSELRHHVGPTRAVPGDAELMALLGQGARWPAAAKSWAEDVFSSDDYHRVGGEPELFPPVPGIPYFVSESVGALNPTYRWFDPPSVLAGQAFAHALAHDQAQSDIRYAGLLAWAGFDYYSAAQNRKNWNTLRTPGVVDTFRVPKPGAAIYKSQVDPATRPVIVPVFFWDSALAPAGRGPDSMFATNCDRLEILRAARTSRPRRRTGSGSAIWPTRPPSPASPWTAAPSRTSGWTATSGRRWPPCSSCPPTPAGTGCG